MLNKIILKGRLTTENARLREENRAIRDSSVSHEVYAAVAAERDAAVEDIECLGADKARDYRNQTFSSPCRYCKHYETCDFIPTETGCCFKWRGTTSKEAKTEDE